MFKYNIIIVYLNSSIQRKNSRENITITFGGTNLDLNLKITIKSSVIIVTYYLTVKCQVI